MKALAIISNLIIPGGGSFLIGAPGQGVGQILIWGIGFLMTVMTLGIGGIIGIPMMIGAWIWGIVTAAGGPQQNVHVIVTAQDRPGPTT
jgi:TM2 domain-containing membrane protein YozV